MFFAPTGDHYRTRLTHTLEVSQIARTIAKALALNEELTEAIALGHDLGHTPFGHQGERVLAALMPGGFEHYEQSLRIVDVLERDGAGLNLTWEVRDGIARHSKGKRGSPIGARRHGEGLDARRADRPRGRSHRLRQSRHRRCHPSRDPAGRPTCRRRRSPCSARRTPPASAAWSRTSCWRPGRAGLREIAMSAAGARRHARPARVPVCVRLRERTVHGRVQEGGGHPRRALGEGPRSARATFLDERTLRAEGVDAAARDFLAGMTDRYAVALYEHLFIPKPWVNLAGRWS